LKIILCEQTFNAELKHAQSPSHAGYGRPLFVVTHPVALGARAGATPPLPTLPLVVLEPVDLEKDKDRSQQAGQTPKSITAAANGRTATRSV
jgi:hypothetical protein